jgi:hypothetical protein
MKQTKEERAAIKRAYYLENREKSIKASYERVKLTRIRNSNYIQEYKLNHPCIDCGFSDPRALDFDHVRGEKSANISILAYSASLEKLQEEIDKCDIRCANCHRIATAERK